MMTSKFQQRHYEWLAEFIGKELRSVIDPDRAYFLHGMRQRLATSLGADNERFSREKFIQRIDDVASGRRSVKAS